MKLNTGVAKGWICKYANFMQIGPKSPTGYFGTEHTTGMSREMATMALKVLMMQR